MSNPWTYLEVKRSKVKVTRSINAHIVNTQYLPNRKAYEFQTWYTDRARRPVSLTSAMTSNVKGQGRKVTWSIWQVLAHKSRTKSHTNTKVGRKLPTPQAITRTCIEVKRSKVKVTWSIIAETESPSPTNFKLRRRLEHALSTAMAS